ncbi:integrase core domain-containing protein [Streptomyces sp. NPDC058623]|uniref:integrase core domain-containing protein n=1 Tax=Streptomyces sp. NPDC058623 TaxID=3346563 RepID=UPI0036652708
MGRQAGRQKASAGSSSNWSKTPTPSRDLPLGSRLPIHQPAIRVSGNRVRNPAFGRRTSHGWDNALAESFFSTIKRELLGTSARPSRAAAHTAIFDFIEAWYNLHRLHSNLGYLSPAEYESALAA